MESALQAFERVYLASKCVSNWLLVSYKVNEFSVFILILWARLEVLEAEKPSST
jgi:hypothetical protein